MLSETIKHINAMGYSVALWQDAELHGSCEIFDLRSGLSCGFETGATIEDAAAVILDRLKTKGEMG